VAPPPLPKRQPFSWAGQTVACLASGPSLTAADVASVQAAGVATIVTNSTWRAAPWAQVLVAHDAAWIKLYLADLQAAAFGGRILTCAAMRAPGVESLRIRWPLFKPFGNSGAAAVSLAVFCGARRVVMLGFDCQHTGGATHWHGSHPAPLGDAQSVHKWPLKFAQVADYARRRGADVVNATPTTALTCFRRAPLAAALQPLPEHAAAA
jgi:hypothetical protein